jgi:hypothetical protein
MGAAGGVAGPASDCEGGVEDWAMQRPDETTRKVASRLGRMILLGRGR